MSDQVLEFSACQSTEPRTYSTACLLCFSLPAPHLMTRARACFCGGSPGRRSSLQCCISAGTAHQRRPMGSQLTSEALQELHTLSTLAKHLHVASPPVMHRSYKWQRDCVLFAIIIVHTDYYTLQIVQGSSIVLWHLIPPQASGGDIMPVLQMRKWRLCLPIQAQIKTKECSHGTLVPFLRWSFSMHLSQQRTISWMNWEPHTSCRWRTRPTQAWMWPRSPEGVISTLTRTEKSVGHTSICPKKE